ncbi:MAG: carbamoyltransferase [Candidatus Omnitrophica bacterium]|nr:carbamoyltransferase [Candidatus Omnitrophota bacterium]
MYILGISAFYHDSAAVLLKEGEIIAAAQEERFTRKKHDQAFPEKAARFCLEFAGISINDIEIVCFYDKPFLKFERILETYMAYAPKGISSFLKAVPLGIKKKLWMKEQIAEVLGFTGKILFTEHHEAHGASAFFPSPFNEAAILTMDGVGEWATASIGVGEKNRIFLKKELNFPHSLGLLYSAFTYYTGFRVNSGEYKLMGLAPYGKAVYKELILSKLLDLKEDGSFKMNMKYFNYCAGLTMTSKAFHDLFGGPPRTAETKITQKHMDLAKSIQDVTEEIMLRMAKHARKITQKNNLVLAGGVALNCVGNGRILREAGYEDIWIQPASGDAGGALGAALFAWHQYCGKERIVDGKNDLQKGSYLGPIFSDEEIERYLSKEKIPFEKISDVPEKIAELIDQQNVIGWFQGRMEFGPRALGARSIIGDARSAKMQEIMNLKIKFRESFRPFAPSVLEEKTEEIFDLNKQSPYMLLVAPLKENKRINLTEEQEKLFGLEKLQAKRSVFPAITHVDYSARIQTVSSRTNKVFYDMIKVLDEKYGCPVIINTSFNVRGEPIVCFPEDAYKCFMRTNMDYLVMGSYLIKKEEQKPIGKDIDWLKEFELD